MRFPEKPTCHAGPTIIPLEWQRRTIQGHREKDAPPPPAPDGPLPFRECSYCGSLHPEDLIAALDGGAKLGGSDWKYGWPHKFYIESIPNPTPDVPRIITSTSNRDASGKMVIEATWAPSGPLWGKFYNEHILDAGFDDEAIAKLLEIIKQHSGIDFKIEGGDLRYAAPSHGYQR